MANRTLMVLALLTASNATAQKDEPRTEPAADPVPMTGEGTTHSDAAVEGGERDPNAGLSPRSEVAPLAEYQPVGEEADGSDLPRLKDEELAGEESGSRVPPICTGELCFEPGLRIRLRYDVVEDDPTVTYVGRNDGFGLSSGRIKLRGFYGEWLHFDLALEGGYVKQTDRNLVAGTTFAALKDAWMEVRPFDFFKVRAGQFKVPFDLTSRQSTSGLRFVDYGVNDRGLRAGEGYQTLGISPPRDLGLMLGSEELAVGPVGLLYLLSVTNGNGTNRAFNDNALPALHGRVAASLWDVLAIGVGGLYNLKTEGVLPNLFDTQDVGFTADVSAEAFGAALEASYSFILTQYPTTGAPDSVAMGASVEAAYSFWFGLGLAYRFSWFDPTSTFDYDAVSEHAVGVRYEVAELPLTLLLDYTVVLEQQGRELTNNRLGAAMQLDF